MSRLKTFAELGTRHRGEPCQEYPGTWIVTHPEFSGSAPRAKREDDFPNFQEALAFARKRIVVLEEQRIEYNPREITIFWKCSDNDPRIGQTWFTPYYQHGKFSMFGEYVLI